MPAEPVDTARGRSKPWRLAKWIFLFLFSLWLLDVGISLLLQHTPLRQKLTAHLESAFGRPVEVGNYDFSLWGGPTLEAESVTVAEDPRFGNEYFLRAESLTVRFRWRSLLRGHLELGTLSLTRPSLNMVRNSFGAWNMNEWLPRPAGTPSQNIPIGPARPSTPVLRFRRVEVDGGRINFKNGDEKIALALTNVKGALETESPGRWRIDLDATPSRAAVILQQVGTLHLAGHLGGTSSRLRPAQLELSWQDASITDVLRLARTYDYGVHGTLAVSVSAQTDGDSWLLDGRAALQQLHRWDLPLRTDNPSLNLIARGKLDLPGSHLELTEATVEAPHSNAHATGVLDWNEPRKGFAPAESATRLEVTFAQIGMNDVLAWIRAFHSNVAEDLALNGSAGLKMALYGWPPRLDRGALVVNGAELNGKELRAPVHIGPTLVRYEKDILSLAPMELFIDRTESAMNFASSFKLGPIRASNLHVTGNISQVRDIFSTSKALGWDISRGWDFEGPLRCDLHWVGASYPWQAQPAGWLDWGGETGSGSLRAPFLNQPVEQIRVRADLKSGGRHIALSSARALGANWSGALNRRNPTDEWQFALVADRLSAADLDLWLNPRWRESFLNRMLPFLNPSASSGGGSSGGATPDSLRASGLLSIGELRLEPFHADHLSGDLTIEGRRVQFENVKGAFCGGTISGSLDAGLVAPPAYHVGFKFTSVDLKAFTSAAPNLAGLFAGTASGEVSFHARGASRADLLASLECQGSARLSDAELRAIDLAESLREAAPQNGSSAFREASAAFSCSNRKLLLKDLTISGASADFAATGSVDFSRNLDLRLQMLPPGEGAPHVTRASGASVAAPAFHLGGSLTAPQIERIAEKAVAPQ
jgi:AsmA-like C-terminal region